MFRVTAGKIWRVLYPAIVLFGSYLAVYIAAIMAYGSFFAGRYESLEDFMAAAGDIVSVTALIVGGLVCYLFYRKDYPVEFGLLTESPKYVISIILLAVFLGHGLNILVSLVNLGGFLGSYSQSTQMLTAGGVVMTIIKSVILAPIAEELAFRGLTFRRMELYTSFWPAAVVSSLLFALYHMNLLQGIYAFPFGLMLCLVYRVFRNIIAAIIMHAAANAFTVLFMLTGLDYPAVWVYVAVMTAAFAVSAILYCLVIRNAGR